MYLQEFQKYKSFLEFVFHLFVHLPSLPYKYTNEEKLEPILDDP